MTRKFDRGCSKGLTCLDKEQINLAISRSSVLARNQSPAFITTKEKYENKIQHENFYV